MSSGLKSVSGKGRDGRDGSPRSPPGSSLTEINKIALKFDRKNSISLSFLTKLIPIFNYKLTFVNAQHEKPVYYFKLKTVFKRGFKDSDLV